MADQTCNWTGASGAKYLYHIYPRGHGIAAGQMGNYIYSKQNAERKWVPIYIREGDLCVRSKNNHHQIKCIDGKGATHMHMHLNANEANRKSEESDLLGNYTNTYVPNGCNVKIGG
ncbi:MAG: hypothetical protein ACLQF1_15045 [Methyloceanibacter sp.]